MMRLNSRQRTSTTSKYKCCLARHNYNHAALLPSSCEAPHPLCLVQAAAAVHDPTPLSSEQSQLRTESERTRAFLTN
jgi:hypothetical protein